MAEKSSDEDLSTWVRAMFASSFFTYLPKDKKVVLCKWMLAPDVSKRLSTDLCNEISMVLKVKTEIIEQDVLKNRTAANLADIEDNED